MSGQHGDQDVCLHFLNGLCRFGADCAKRHDPSALRPLCIYFERGSCNRGASCLYAHGADDRQPKLAPSGPGGGRGRGGRGRGGRNAGRARGGGRGRGRQGGAVWERPPPPVEDPLQVYRDATEQELDMLEQWEDEEEARLALAAYERMQRQHQDKQEEAASAAAGDAAGEPSGEGMAAEAAAEEEGAKAAGTDGSKPSADGSSGSGSGEEGAEDSTAAAAGGSAAAAEGAAGAVKREPPAICSEQYGKVVTPPFLPTNWCPPCRRSFTTPAGLLSHLKATHKQDGERIAALEALRRCPCGREFEGFSQLSTHIRNVHCKPTAAQREGAAIGDALFRMAMMGGLGGGYSSSDDDEYGFGGHGPFSGADVEELLCQGVKPWDEDAADVLAVLNGDFDDYGYY